MIMYMEGLLRKFEFAPGENSKEWVKGNWTVRLEKKDQVEVFDTTINDEGWLYYYGDASDLEDILEEIESFPAMNI